MQQDELDGGQPGQSRWGGVGTQHMLNLDQHTLTENRERRMVAQGIHQANIKRDRGQGSWPVLAKSR